MIIGSMAVGGITKKKNAYHIYHLVTNKSTLLGIFLGVEELGLRMGIDSAFIDTADHFSRVLGISYAY